MVYPAAVWGGGGGGGRGGVQKGVKDKSEKTGSESEFLCGANLDEEGGALT